MTLETDLNKMTRCMKALNGSVWMDSKLRLDWAHEHFKERLAREAKELGDLGGVISPTSLEDFNFQTAFVTPEMVRPPPALTETL